MKTIDDLIGNKSLESVTMTRKQLIALCERVAAECAAPVPQAASTASAAQEGWKLVPLEPTDEMIRKVQSMGGCLAMQSELRYEYKAMLAASPQPEVAHDQSARDAERYRFLRYADLDAMEAKYWPGKPVPEGEAFDEAVDGAILDAQVASVEVFSAG